MKIFLPSDRTGLQNISLTNAELFRKNVIYMNKIRTILFFKEIDAEATIILNSLLKFFEDIEAYEYCSDILRIIEMNKSLFEKLD